MIRLRRLVLFAFLFCSALINTAIAQDNLNSLKASLESEKDPIKKIEILGKIGNICDDKDIEEYANQSLGLISKLSADIKAKNKNKIEVEEARAYYNLSYYFYKSLVYTESQRYAQKAILILTKNQLDTTLLTDANNNMASAYMALGKHDLALPYFKDNLRFDTYKKDEASIATDCINLASAFKALHQNDSAIYYAKQCISIREKQGSQQQLINAYTTLGTVYLEENLIDSAKIAINKSLSYAILLSDKGSYQSLYYTLGLLEKKVGNTKGAEEFFMKALASEKGSGGYTSIVESHNELFKLYDAAKDYSKALYHFKLYKTYEDSAVSEEMKKDAEINLVSFDSKKESIESEKQRAVDNAKAEAENQRNKLVIMFAIFVIALVVVFLLFVLNRARLLRKQKKFIEQQRDLLSTQQEELVLKNELLDKKNTTITENINYAQNIQGSLIPTEQKITAQLGKECFVLFHPKDIVSGDFYWSYAKDNKQLLVLADCTGHGVTGAFISILAIKSLEKVLAEVPINDLATILKRLHQEFSLTFGEGSNEHFGIELVLCCFDSNSKELLITGSSNSVCIVHKGELTSYQFESMSIGTKDADLNNIKTHKIDLQANSSVYLYTDGYYDQKGGPQNKKYLSKRLKTTLTEIEQLPMRKQKEVLIKNYSDWKQNHEQIDDVSVIGIKI